MKWNKRVWEEFADSPLSAPDFPFKQSLSSFCPPHHLFLFLLKLLFFFSEGYFAFFSNHSSRFNSMYIEV